MQYEKSRDFIEKVKACSDIVEVIGTRIPLSNGLMAKCPFHDDKNPSLSVNSIDQYFFCFGCGVGGDVINFLMLYENIGFAEALRTLAEESGIRIPARFNRR